MNRHGIVTTKRLISFFSFKGDSKESSLDQITLPPSMGMWRDMNYAFGEWLKREGHDWESLPEETLCRLGIDWWNKWGHDDCELRRFDRMATKKEIPT